MSKLSEVITAVTHGNKTFVTPPLISVTKEAYKFGSFMTPEYYEYRVEARFGTKALFKHGQPAGVFDLEVKRIKRNIIEAVFGEFRSDFRDLQIALSMYDVDKAKEVVDSFMEKMYSVEDKA